MGLTLKEKKAVTAQIVTRYAKAGKNEKTKILDEFVQLTGYNRKYAISVLRKCFKKKTYTYNGKKKKRNQRRIPSRSSKFNQKIKEIPAKNDFKPFHEDYKKIHNKNNPTIRKHQIKSKKTEKYPENQLQQENST